MRHVEKVETIDGKRAKKKITIYNAGCGNQTPAPGRYPHVQHGCYTSGKGYMLPRAAANYQCAISPSLLEIIPIILPDKVVTW
jgi:hypothetical protein